jgi:hypothetical protein
MRKIASRKVRSLAPGASAIQRAEIAIPSKLRKGSYRVAACVDSTHKLHDSERSEETGQTECRISSLVLTVHKHGRHGTVVTFSSSPPPGQAIIAVAAAPSHRATATILLILGGVMSIVLGIALVGTHRREPAAFA